MGSLAGRWRRFAPTETSPPEDLVEMAKRTAALSRCSVQTEVGRAKADVRGFVGRVELRSLAPSPGAQALVATLCRFAEFAGVGIKTAQGMGMVRLARS